MTKTTALKHNVSVIETFPVLVIVSDFVLGISDFLNEKMGFRTGTAIGE